jgi:hypothetical protein
MRATVVMWLELCLGLHLTPHCCVYMQYNEEFSHTRLDSAHERKQAKYDHLLTAAKQKGYHASHYIGDRIARHTPYTRSSCIARGIKTAKVSFL